MDEALNERKERTAEVVRRLGNLYPSRRRLGAEEGGYIETLIATILSQNTADVNSHRAYMALRASYPDWQSVAVSDLHQLQEVIRPAGLAHQKSRTIQTALNTLHERYGAYQPPDLSTRTDADLLEELTALPGVGLKTASCVLMFALGRDICAVDTHVHRVVNRLGIVATSTPDRTFHELRRLIPRRKARRFHVDLIRFGRHICKAQRPHCFECPLYDICDWPQKEEHAREAIPGRPAVSGDLLLLDMVRDAERERRS